MSILANSEEEYEKIGELLKSELPSYRQAYSDRTAWLMACLSELAYIRFNPLFANEQAKDYFMDTVRKLAGEKKKSALIKLIDMLNYDHNRELRELDGELEYLNLQLIKTFDNKGTQAILVKSNDFIALAFRGTEATSIKDIKSDCDARITPCESGGRIHTGFDGAFGQVAMDIQQTLNEDGNKDLPLFITGHSLGGALATIAAKKLRHQRGIAACYTFGAPRVGDENWMGGIKTHVYRVVNAADCVTMLPPGDEFLTVVSWISGWFWQPLKSWLTSKFTGYYHCGDMRYLTNCGTGKYDSVKLLYSVSFFRRVKGWMAKKSPWSKFLADHSISIYRKKLYIIANRRNR